MLSWVKNLFTRKPAKMPTYGTYSPPLVVAEKYLKKGSSVYLEGQIETRKYTDKAGVEKYTTEITLRPYHGELVLLDNKASAKPADDVDESEPAAQPATTNNMNDEIPF